MASRASLSKYIKNEYEWRKAMERERRTENWPLSLPRVYERGAMGRLQWLRMEYINGVSGAESAGVLTAAIRPVAAVIADIVGLNPLALSRLTLRPHRALQERVRKRLASYAQRIGYGKIGSDLVPLLARDIGSLQSAPVRGDLGIGNIVKDKSGKLWLVDSEFASSEGIKFYDVGYFYFRLGVNANRIDLGERFLREFIRVYPMTSLDEKTLRWMLVYRLVGGYFEALKNRALYPRIAKLRRVVEEKYFTRSLLLSGDISH
jgi:hypothetical protein